jgi:uncharacterized protein YbaA (DUF1428 family)
MSAWIWLLATAVAAVAAYLVGWPAWQQYRSRESRDLNVDRYNAWRGRAMPRGDRPSEGMTLDERRRIYAGIGLGIVAVFCLVGFFTYA